MKHGSLFSGIGGFDLSAEWMGWENVFHCEINPFGQKILKHYWPNAISYEDITKTDFTIHRGRIDILTGGFPCQPFSVAGKRKGTEDDRHLWPEMLRAIREIQPTWIVGENVYGIINWSKGLVFEQVQTDLEAEGYEVQSVILPACAVNAPHKRERIWIIAHTNRNGGRSEDTRTNEGKSKRGRLQEQYEMELLKESNNSRQLSTNTNSTNNKTRTFGKVLEQSDWQKTNGLSHVECSRKWQDFPTQSPICSRDDGISSRLESITFSKWRNESIKGLGNAIVPSLAYQIFKTIQLIENH